MRGQDSLSFTQVQESGLLSSAISLTVDLVALPHDVTSYLSVCSIQDVQGTDFI